MRVRPTEGSAPVTTSTMAASRSPAGGPPTTARGAGAAGHELGRADVAARHFGLRLRAIAEVAQDGRAAAIGALHEGPHRAVLAPARALRIARRRPAGRPRAPVEARDDAPAQAIDGRRRRTHHAGPREVADDGAHALGLRIAGGRHRQVVASVDRGAQQRAGHRLERRVVDLGALDEEDVQALVAALGEEQRARRAPVAPRAPGLLVVGLDRPRHGGVGDRAHVGLVDAHAERVGGHHHLDLAGHEAPLGVGALLAPEARVVGEHLGRPARPPARRPGPRSPRACPRRRWPGAPRRPPARRRAAIACRPRRGTARRRRRGSAGRSPW